MVAPRFSLVVPTRNRARTLEFCLRTCLAQAFDDFEVVVSDNCSPPETREVALSFGDPRIKYFRTPEDLSVTDSFEFALEQATGEYVTMLGDDDGYLLHALAEMDRMLKLVRTPALHWNPVLYSWPDVGDRAYAAAGTLVVPLRQGPRGCALQRHEARPMIAAAANGDISYDQLPMVYCCAVVHRDVLGRLRQQAGRVFKSRAPDIYIAFAVAHAAGSYYSLAAPLTISGTSASSTGMAHLRDSGSAIDRQFLLSSERAGHAWHRTVPELPSLTALVADAALHFKDTLAPDAVAVDRRRLVEAVLADLAVDSEASWRAALAACRRALDDDDALLAWFDANHAARSLPTELAGPRRQAMRRYGGTFMALDASEHGVADIYGAAQLCESLLGYRRDGIGVDLRDGPAELKESLTELQAKERQIQTMNGALLEQQRTMTAQERTMIEQERIMLEQQRAIEGQRQAIDERDRQLVALQARLDAGWLRALVPSAVRRWLGRSAH